jgi:hypothetical protein
MKKPDITKGEWKVAGDGIYWNYGHAVKDCWYVEFGNDNECIAEIVHGKANAKAISAVPDMIDALISACKSFEYLYGLTKLPSIQDECFDQMEIIGKALQKAGVEL